MTCSVDVLVIWNGFRKYYAIFGIDSKNLMISLGKPMQIIIILRHHGRRHRGIPDERMSCVYVSVADHQCKLVVPRQPQTVLADKADAHFQIVQPAPLVDKPQDF